METGLETVDFWLFRSRSLKIRSSKKIWDDELLDTELPFTCQIYRQFPQRAFAFALRWKEESVANAFPARGPAARIYAFFPFYKRVTINEKKIFAKQPTKTSSPTRCSKLIGLYQY